MELWHPKADRIPLETAGSFTGGGHKIVLHTTEGTSIDGATAAFRANRSAPHFCIDPHREGFHVAQYVPLNQAGRSLEHVYPPETNRANAIQIEMVGYASKTDKWSDDAYKRVRRLVRWIHKEFDVPLRASVTFKASGAKRMGPDEFFSYAGICGHEHVPGNSHYDPGNFHVRRVLD